VVDVLNPTHVVKSEVESIDQDISCFSLDARLQHRFYLDRRFIVVSDAYMYVWLRRSTCRLALTYYMLRSLASLTNRGVVLTEMQDNVGERLRGSCHFDLATPEP